MLTLAGERTLLTGGPLTLTSHRVRYDARGWGTAKLTSIMLEEVCSVGVQHSSQPILLVIAVLAALYGASEGGDMAGTGMVIGLVLVVIYAATRRQVLRIASADTKIEVNVSAMGYDGVVAFVDQLEAAKNDRYLLMCPPESTRWMYNTASNYSQG